MQLDKGIYILTGQILNQNFQENQKRMQKHIYYAQMTGWKPSFQCRHKGTEVLPHTIGVNKIVVPFLRTFGGDYMGTVTKFI